MTARKRNHTGETANPSPAGISLLQVFDRLEVGPVKLEPRRILAPYRLTVKGKTEQTNLIYRYEEKVFNPR